MQALVLKFQITNEKILEFIEFNKNIKLRENMRITTM